VKACVCVGGYGLRGEKLSIKCTYRFGGVVQSGSSFQCQDLWWYGLWSSDCCLV
jgi:hypothetical protein